MAQLTRQLGPEAGQALAHRVYSARLIGSEPTLVLHGGGNVSVKCEGRTVLGESVPTIHVKASGHGLADLTPEGLPALDLTYLRRLRALDALDDREMVNQFRSHLYDASAPTPSIETLVHAFLPPAFVDHSHADAVLALTNQSDGEARVRDALGDRVAIIPYVRPGFDLAKVVAETYDRTGDVDAFVLMRHGLFTFGEDARTAYERHVDVVRACERWLEEHCRRRPTVTVSAPARPSELAARVAPLLRGLLAEVQTGRPHRPPLIMDWRATDSILELVNSEEGEALAGAGPLTPDHVIRTRTVPLFVCDPRWDDVDALKSQLGEAIAAFRTAYADYVVGEGGGPSTLDVFDPSPRVVLLPGAGALCFGRSKQDARVAADIVEHTAATKIQVHGVGEYLGLSSTHLFEMEFHPMEVAKLHRRGSVKPLDGRVVMVSGGAGAIGVGIAEACLDAGAHVALADRDQVRLASVVSHLANTWARDAVWSVVMDVTDERSVQAGFEDVCRQFGGIDVVVPNAGVAQTGQILDVDPTQFREVVEVNLMGYLSFIQAGVRVMKQQGIGGHVVINASKNVFAPGEGFAAYSASKAAGHQLGKVAALELAPFGIRVNMINADGIFGDEAYPSGLWARVGPERAKQRGTTVEQLPEYYRERNLLKIKVAARDVGNAVVFFASGATPTTGATLPVDGGIPAAFPR